MTPLETEVRRCPRVARFAFVVALGLCTLIFAGLGIWQIERRSWKLELIARVEARIHAAPVAAPGPDSWSGIGAATDEYRRVVLQGRYLDMRETLTMAVTERGPGFWVLVPFRSDRGFTVLVNRGFVPPERRDPRARAAGQASGAVSVTGLVRLSEPGGGFLRDNDPAAGRWYSRDVGAIARAHGLGPVAPYFIDADATPNPGGFPVGGLTVLRFSDNHLVYALTWFALALMAMAASVFVLRAERRRRAGA